MVKRLSGTFSNRVRKDRLLLTHSWGADSQGRDNHERVAHIDSALKGVGKKTWFKEENQLTGNAIQHY